MSKAIRISAYFGETDGRIINGAATVSYILHGNTEMLSVMFEGAYQIDVPFRKIAALVAQSRREPEKELSTRLAGHYSDSRVRLRPGKVNVWFRRSRNLEMLTLSFEQNGQISLPYMPIARMVSAERSWTV